MKACLLPKISFLTLGGEDKRKRNGQGWGEGDYSREAINRGTATIRGHMLDFSLIAWVN